MTLDKLLGPSDTYMQDTESLLLMPHSQHRLVAYRGVQLGNPTRRGAHTLPQCLRGKRMITSHSDESRVLLERFRVWRLDRNTLI